MLAASVDALSRLVESGVMEGYTSAQAEYATISLPMNKRFKPSPSFILYPKSVADISSVMGLVTRATQPSPGSKSQSAITVTARSGGHNYAAFSSGEGSEGSHISIVIDLKYFDEITYDAATETATIGAGCRLGQVRDDLAKFGRALPHGTCPSVGIGGHAAHGGHGFASRAWGLLCDRVCEHEVALADGTIARTSAVENEDLFWALRGAASSFGIITSYKVRTEPMPKVNVVFRVSWYMDAEKAAEALMNYQAWLPDVPAQLGMGFLYCKGNHADNLNVQIEGHFIGDLRTFHAVVDEQFRIIGGSTPMWKQEVHEYPWLKALEWLSIGTAESDTFYVKSFVVKEDAPLVPAQARSLADYAVKIANKSESGWFIMGDNWGGRDSAINSVPLEATSLGSRSTLFAFQLYSRSLNGLPPFPADGIQLVTGMWNALAEPVGKDKKHAGITNYVDAELSRVEAHEAYYGSHLPRLRQLKKKYDPSDVFRFKHSITPAD